jgi:hypothetical protein
MTTTKPSTPTRSTFHGFGAWVGRLDSRTACAWWPDDPNQLGFDRKQLIEVDLAKNPAAYLSGAIKLDEIEVDDAPPDGGLTKLGPTWPTGSTINSVWLEAGFYKRLASPPPFPQPFMGCHAYELTSVLEWPASPRGAPRRFWGVHAEISAEQGTLALCTVWTPATSARHAPAGSWWIDLAAQADPIANGLTAIGTGSAPKRGALFLDATAFRGLAMAGPKLPPLQGGQLVPRPRR